ncbi:MAG: ABC transporter permease [Clostridiales bacterium]|nr:ABC transporter permease [Clostridiales bacterium]
MTLNKRYRRSIKSNLAFYVSTGILTIITLLLFYLFYIGGTGINSFGDEFFEKFSLEDAHFTTYTSISDEEISELEDEYDLTLEAMYSVDVVEGDTTIRVFLPTEKINLYDVTGGCDLSSDSDIIISKGYAVNMNVEIGDTVTLCGEQFTVVGYFQRPDYLYMLKEEDDSYKNISTFFLAYVTDEAFERLGNASVTYLVRYNGDDDIEFRRAVNEKYYMQSYLSSDENMRILMVHEQADLFIVMAYLLLLLMPSLAAFLVCIIISRKTRDEQKLIGTLSALGFSNRQIILHYSGFAALSGFLSGTISFVMAEALAQFYGECTLSDYEPLHITFSLPIGIRLLGIIIPTFIYTASAALTTRSLLKNDTIDMLCGKAGEKNNLKTALRKKKFSFRFKLSFRNLLGNPARDAAVTLGIFLGSAIILICFGMIDTMDNMSMSALDSIGSFEYEYIFSALLIDDPEYGSKMLVTTYEHENSGKSLTFMGITDDNPYLSLTDENGDEISEFDGWYISTAAAAALSINSGDTVEFISPLTLDSVTITISGTVDYDIGSVVFTSLYNMDELLGADEGTYNAVMSDKELEFEDVTLRKTIKKSSISEQLDTIYDEMGVLIYTCVLLGIIICVASVYAVVNMTIGENRTNISMLKVLGYKDATINRIILGTNHILLPLGILLSIPAVFVILDMFWLMMLDYDVMLFTTYIKPTSYILTVIFTSLCYFGSIWLVGRKTLKIGMDEALKEQRE